MRSERSVISSSYGSRESAGAFQDEWRPTYWVSLGIDEPEDREDGK